MSNKAFTLIELSIVLVVLGILVLSAVFGARILHTAELRSVITQTQEYKIAVSSFQTDYEALPGDSSNASSFFPSASDGNNDGQIGNGLFDDDTEVYWAWQHLQLARYAVGSFSGSGSFAQINNNVPAARDIAGGFSFLWSNSPFSYADPLGRAFRGNYLVFGNEEGTDNFLSAAALTPRDAYFIDNKIDEGTADFGSVLSGNGAGQTTCTMGSAPTIDYNFQLDTISCVLFIKL